jgi:hypothetical protein
MKILQIDKPENSQTENREKAAIAHHYHLPNAKEPKIFEQVNTYIDNNPNN